MGDLTAKAEVSIKNIRDNYIRAKDSVGHGSICSAVLKGNAYGVGIEETASVLSSLGCKDFWVNNIKEAFTVKNISNDANIYILEGINDEKEIEVFLNTGFIPVITDISQLKILYGYKIPIVVYFETGMGRAGLQMSEIGMVKELNLNVKYIMSHLSCASDPQHFLNNDQLEKFISIKSYFPNAKYSLANSEGIFLGQDYHFDMVRVGGALYGASKNSDKFQQVLNYKVPILNKKILTEDSYIGYNATCSAKKGSKIFTLNAGYINGYPRSMSNKGRAYCCGHYLPIIGIISMNLIIVDASFLNNNMFNEIKSLELVGEKVTLREVADLADTDARDVLSSLLNNNEIFYIR